MIISADILIPLFLAFGISVVLGPFVIPFLQKLKIGQTERVEGVKSHLKKAGTPTMGGLIILISILITSLFYIGKYPRIIPVLFLTLGFGIIGFLDDYLKVVLRRSDGLMPKQKMLGQIIVTTIFVVYIWVMDSSCLEMIMPFHLFGIDVLSGDVVKWIATPLAYVVIIGCGEVDRHPSGLCCDHRHGKRCEFYGRLGRTGHRGDLHGGSVLYRGFHGAGRTDRTHHSGSAGSASWLFAFQCTSGQGLYGGYRFPGFGRLCGGRGLYDEAAHLYTYYRAGVFCGSIVCDDPGDLF